MFQKLKQYKDLRDTAKDAQNVMADETAHGAAAGDKVNVIIDGNQKITKIDIDASLMAPEHKSVVEEGVKEAIEKASKKMQKIMIAKMRSGELTMPDLGSLSKGE